MDEFFSSAGLHIIALQEVEPRVMGSCVAPLHHVQNHADVHGLDGTQMWVLHSLTKFATQSVPINARMLRVTLCIDGRTLHIISAHAPTECDDPLDKDAFWSQLDIAFVWLYPVVLGLFVWTPMQLLDPLCATALVLSLQLQESDNGMSLLVCVVLPIIWQLSTRFLMAHPRGPIIVVIPGGLTTLPYQVFLFLLCKSAVLTMISTCRPWCVLTTSCFVNLFPSPFSGVMLWMN